jgi:hypothetical protein
MMLARLLAIAIGILPLIIMATLARSATSSMLTALGAGHLSSFETAMALSIPYLILVYCAIYRPIVNFFQTISGKTPPGQGNSQK